MQTTILCCMLWTLCQTRIFPTEDWTSGPIDLGNGGDTMFYIHFKSRDKNATAPVILYMAGGPGTSGEYNLLLENGPYVANEKGSIVYNIYSWCNKSDLIYVDQPVGVGFSKAKDASTYCRDGNCVAENVYRMLHALFQKEPALKGRPFYVSGVSYAGHYVPAVSEYLIKKKDPEINFRGAFIDGAWIDAETQFMLDAAYLYMKGIFGLYQYLKYTITPLLCRIFVLFDRLGSYEISSEMNDNKDDAANLTNSMNIELNREFGEEAVAVRDFFNDRNTQTDLGVCCKTFAIKNRTAGALLRAEDWLISYSPKVSFILQSGYPLTLLYGDADYTCQYLGGLKVAESLDWTGNSGFVSAPWSNVVMDGETRGVKKSYGKFTFYRILHAGHLSPKDQPRVLQQFIEEFIRNNP